MGDGPRGIEIFPDHFKASTSDVDTPKSRSSSLSHTKTEFEHSSSSRLWARRRLMSAASMLNLCSLRRLSWGNDTDEQDKVVLSVKEVKSLQSELAELEEREPALEVMPDTLHVTIPYLLSFGKQVVPICYKSSDVFSFRRWKNSERP